MITLRRLLWRKRHIGKVAVRRIVYHETCRGCQVQYFDEHGRELAQAQGRTRLHAIYALGRICQRQHILFPLQRQLQIEREREARLHRQPSEQTS